MKKKHEINVPRAKAPPTFTQEPLAGPSKMDVIRFGNKEIPLNHVKQARHTKLIILAAELAAMVFTSEEMALSTIKGSRTNAYKTAFKKQSLDENKLQGIVDYVASYFGKSPSDAQVEVYKSVTYKLNNFTRTAEGKRIINQHREAIQASQVHCKSASEAIKI